jgi:hypothetical protein
MKKFLYWTAAIVVIVLALFIYWKFFFTFSVGHRAGLLQKFSYKGTIFKTYEGEMVLSSVQSNKEVALASEKFLFSVINDVLADKLKLLEGRMMIIHYHETNGTLWWRGESRYVADSITLQD